MIIVEIFDLVKVIRIEKIIFLLRVGFLFRGFIFMWCNFYLVISNCYKNIYYFWSDGIVLYF